MPVFPPTSKIYNALFGADAMENCLSDTREVELMIHVEVALARVQANVGLIDKDKGRVLADALTKISIDPRALNDGTLSAGVPIPALVKALRSKLPDDLAHWLHWGATSQDIVDCTHVIQYGECLTLIQRELQTLIDTLHQQSNTNAQVVMAARTRSQLATPITFGLRIAQWAHPLIDASNELPNMRRRFMKVQLGGASGSNTAMNRLGPEVTLHLAKELGLHHSPPWHTNRSGIIGLAAWLSQCASALRKFAHDIVLMGRVEIGELSAGAGGGSSTMPQKSNPVQAEAIQTLCAIIHTHQQGINAASSPSEERDGGSWAIEWMLVPQMLIATGSALRHANALASTMKPNAKRMEKTVSENPELLAEAASFHLSQYVTRAEALAIVKGALENELPLIDALRSSSPISLDWEKLLQPSSVIEPCKTVANQIFNSRETSEF